MPSWRCLCLSSACGIPEPPHTPLCPAFLWSSSVTGGECGKNGSSRTPKKKKCTDGNNEKKEEREGGTKRNVIKSQVKGHHCLQGMMDNKSLPSASSARFRGPHNGSVAEVHPSLAPVMCESAGCVCARFKVIQIHAARF